MSARYGTPVIRAVTGTVVTYEDDVALDLGSETEHFPAECPDREEPGLVMVHTDAQGLPQSARAWKPTTWGGDLAPLGSVNTNDNQDPDGGANLGGG